jgi:hypothetical protein
MKLNESAVPRLMGLRALLDFLDERRNDGCSIFRVMKFQMHAPTNEMRFEHRTAPSRACDSDQDWLRAVPRMT